MGRGVRRLLFLAFGFASLALGVLGLFLPLLPTVPFVLLAAFSFARSSPRLETWLVEHPKLGPPIRDWRERGAVRPAAKRSAIFAFALSALIGLFLLPFPWLLMPVAAAFIGATWIARRPEA